MVFLYLHWLFQLWKMRRTKLILITLIYFSFLPVFSQQTEYETDKLDVSGYTADDSENEANDEHKRLKTNVEVGTSFMYSPGNFYGPSYYVAPRLSYYVTPRFYLSAGIGVEHANLYSLYDSPYTESEMLPMTRAFLYAQGNYLLTEKLVLNGTVFKTMKYEPRIAQHPYLRNYNYQGVDLGLQYNINPNFSVGFHMRMSNINYQSQGLIPPDALVPVPGF